MQIIKKTNFGITMAELLISIFLINMVIFGMFLTVSLLLKAGQKNIDTSSGYAAANSILKEYVIGFKKDEPPPKTGTSILGSKTYTYKITVTPEPAATVNLYYITADVDWKDSVTPDGRVGYLNASVSAIVNK